MKVQLDFAIDDAANSLDQTTRLVVLLPSSYDFVERCSWRDGEGGLVDDLIAGVKVGDDEVACRAVRQHAVGVGIVIRPNAGEAWQDAMV